MLHCKLFRIVIFVSAIVFGLCLKCHVCNSKLDPNCLDPFNTSHPSSTLQECESGPRERFGGGGGGRALDVVDIIMQPEGGGEIQEQNVMSSQSPGEMEVNNKNKIEKGVVCQKIVVIVGNESITGRGCSPQSVDGMHPCDAVRLSAPEHVRHCVTCLNDACNAASTVNVTPELMSVVSFVFTALYYVL